MNGSPANNNSRVTFGYPGVTFQQFEQRDAGTYTLTATNYHLDNNSVVVGMDTGTFTLDVQCKFGSKVEGSWIAKKARQQMHVSM